MRWNQGWVCLPPFYWLGTDGPATWKSQRRRFPFGHELCRIPSEAKNGSLLFNAQILPVAVYGPSGSLIAIIVNYI